MRTNDILINENSSPYMKRLVLMKRAGIRLTNKQKNRLNESVSRNSNKFTVKPLYGQLQLNKNGSFFYKNNAPIQAKDSFAYRLLSSKGNSEEVWVHLSRKKITRNHSSYC